MIGWGLGDRTSPAAHFAGIEQAVGIDLLLKVQLGEVNGFHAAIFDRVGVGVEDDGSVAFVVGDDFLESIGATVANELQSRRYRFTADAQKF